MILPVVSVATFRGRRLDDLLVKWIEPSWGKVQSLCSVWVLSDDEFITRQRLPAHDLAQKLEGVDAAGMPGQAAWKMNRRHPGHT